MGANQHFVPRFLLQRFSSNGKQFSLFLLKTGEIKNNIGIAGQAKKINIYGKDQTLEKILNGIEGDAAEIIRVLVDQNTPILTIEDESKLKLFIAIQHTRTPFSINSQNESVDTFFKHTFKHDPVIGPYVDKVRMTIKNPYAFHVATGAKLFPSISDLRYTFALNKTDEDFIIGQHPVVIMNPFLSMYNWTHSYRGLLNKGCVILLPVDSKKIIIFYDGLRYKITKSSTTPELNKTDIRLINKMQFYYTDDCVYFEDTNFKIESLCKYRDETEYYRIGNKAKLKVISRKTHKGKVEEITEHGINEPKEHYTLSFLGIRISELEKGLGPSMDISREGMRDFSNSFL